MGHAAVADHAHRHPRVQQLPGVEFPLRPQAVILRLDQQRPGQPLRPSKGGADVGRAKVLPALYIALRAPPVGGVRTEGQQIGQQMRLLLRDGKRAFVPGISGQAVREEGQLGVD